MSMWRFLSSSIRMLTRTCTLSSLQPDVREEDFWNSQQRPSSFPGQPVCVFPDSGARLFCHGIRSRRRPDDAHPRWCFLRAQGRVSVTAAPHSSWLITVSNQHLIKPLYPSDFMQPASCWDYSSYMNTRLCTGKHLEGCLVKDISCTS